jgi:hypothetical protein
MVNKFQHASIGYIACQQSFVFVDGYGAGGQMT